MLKPFQNENCLVPFKIKYMYIYIIFSNEGHLFLLGQLVVTICVLIIDAFQFVC